MSSLTYKIVTTINTETNKLQQTRIDFLSDTYQKVERRVRDLLLENFPNAIGETVMLVNTCLADKKYNPSKKYLRELIGSLHTDISDGYLEPLGSHILDPYLHNRLTGEKEEIFGGVDSPELNHIEYLQ